MTTPYTKNHMVVLPPLAKGVVETQQIIFNVFKIGKFFDAIIQKGSIQKYVLKGLKIYNKVCNKSFSKGNIVPYFLI